MTKRKPKQKQESKRLPPAVAVSVLIVVGTIVGAFVLEGAARLLWNEPWYERLLAEQRAIQLYDYRENAWGLRDQNYALEKSADTKRVFMLGDSFTFGMGVPDDRKIFPEMIERSLNESGRNVEILNAGKPATLTGDWVESWVRIGAEFDPDLVVVVFFLRDGTETLFIPEFFMRIRREIVGRNAQSTLYQRFYTYRLYRDQMDRRDIGANYTQRFLNGYFGDDAQTAEWQRAQENLTQLSALTKVQGARMAFVIFPVLVQLTDDYPFEPICDLLEEFAASNGLPVHNLLDDFRGRDASKLWVSPWDQHPNEEGHEIVADALLPFVRDQLSVSD